MVALADGEGLDDSLTDGECDIVTFGDGVGSGSSPPLHAVDTSNATTAALASATTLAPRPSTTTPRIRTLHRGTQATTLGRA